MLSTWIETRPTKTSQAIKLINGLPALEKQMKDQGVMGVETFKDWLAEEKAYLQGLSREPLQETLQMEYYQKKALDYAQSKWLVMTPKNHNTRDYMRSIETERRHVLENHEIDLKVVQGLETKLGYKLRKHIGKALKARLQAVQNALDKYNMAAHALSPPCPELSWDLVVEYAFLADFDLLSDTREDDEEAYLQEQEKIIAKNDTAIAHQIFLQRERLHQFNVVHTQCLRKLASLPGFTESLVPGVPIQARKKREDDMEVDEGSASLFSNISSKERASIRSRIKAITCPGRA
ncbi:hypothetical protein C0992_007679 [Termitomyces sp. T32_za158]|nr:hypothetical protein C0992_007679 [Termitomyces sp. T32_za158]